MGRHKGKTMATLERAYQAAQDVTTATLPGYSNHKAPDIRLAMWATALSAQKELAWNGAQVDALRPYVRANEPLPAEPHAVLAILKSGHRFCCLSDAVHVCWVDWAYHEGLLQPLTHKPGNYAEWVAWRKAFMKVAHGHGFAWKTASFTALLMWPLDCPLVPVDTHVVNRLGEPRSLYSKLGAWKNYNRIEQLVLDEWIANGRPYTLGVWHWYKWSAWRQETGKESRGDACESHNLLSPYVY